MEDKRVEVQLLQTIIVHNQLTQSIWFKVKIKYIKINKLKNKQMWYRKKSMIQWMCRMRHLMEYSKEWDQFLIKWVNQNFNHNSNIKWKRINLWKV